MEITEIYVKRGIHLYNLHNDSGGFVGQFETLCDAALVARYVGCCDMNEEERAQAIAAMKNAQVARQMGVTLNQAKKLAAKATGGGGDFDAGG